jgi:hypothetical protein
MKLNLKKFSPLNFLAPLGAGGLSIAFFAFLNYTFDHGKGLIYITQTHSLLSGSKLLFYSVMEFGMAFFAIIHIVLTIYFIKVLIQWLKTDSYKELMKNPLTSSAIFAPFVSIAMTMNVFLAAVRYFFPSVAVNLQGLMLPGFIVWVVLWLFTMRMEIRVLKHSFMTGFNIDSINFGWLMQAFALSMVTVTGAGIAAMSQNKTIADIAMFMSLVMGSMAIFLVVVKMVSVFKSQFKRDGLPDKQFLPSILIIVPTVTVMAIAIFRFGHYLEHHQGLHLHGFFLIVVTLAYAFETWYLMFGLSLLRDYIKMNLLKEYHVSQWGLICPFVAYSVMGVFVHTFFATNIFVFIFVVFTTAIASTLYLYLLVKQYKCAKNQSTETEEQKSICQ